MKGLIGKPCCFCAGEAIADTRDHQPALVFFNKRQHPDEFVFPACRRCNEASRASENFVRILAVPESIDGEDHSRWLTLLQWTKRNHPTLIDDLLPDTRFIRNVLKEKGIEKPRGILFRDIPMIKMDVEFWRPHLHMVGRKILLALHYQCFGVPLSRSGRVWVLPLTNADVGAGAMPPELLEATKNIAIPVRHKRQIAEQFSIRWGFSNDPPTAVWAFHLHTMINYIGITSELPDWVSHVEAEEDTYGPFSWPHE